MRKSNYAQLIKETPQTLRSHPDEVENSAGGYTFAVTKWERLRRFLIMGAEGGTYYIKEQKLTIENANAILECIHENMQRTLDTIIEVSVGGFAHKQNPALFALALCVAENPGDGPLPREAVAKVVRTGSQLLTFTSYVNELRGWGQGLHRLYEYWYHNRKLNDIVYQTVKYQNRDKWTHRDILRKVRPVPPTDGHSALYKWITDRDSSLVMDAEGCVSPTSTGLALVDAYMEAHYGLPTEKRMIQLIKEFNLSHEMIPTEFKNSKKVWEALSEKMPIHALVRNLASMTAVGLLTEDNFDLLDKIEGMLTNAEYLKQKRMHPMSILIALKTYEHGRGFRGSLQWTPVQRVVDSLDKGFYHAFRAVEPTGKRYCLAIDVSGSMSWPESRISNTNLFCRDAAAAMALVTANVESKHAVYVFDTEFNRIGISPNMRLDTVIRRMERLPARGTDCALPMIEMRKQKKVFDIFIIYTDNETWAGRIKPHEALAQYRKDVNPEAKLIVCGMVSNGFTIADPNDKGMLDICGFDASVPEIISQFALGQV